MAATIVIATPHRRYDRLESRVRSLLPEYDVVRLHTAQQLSSQTLEPLHPVFVFLPHWSWIVPDDVHARFACVIFHMTDLPYGRGGSPLQNLIVRGHQETVMSALKCVSALDAGPIYLKRPLSLAGTAEDILQRASDVMEAMIVEIVRTRPAPVPQEGEPVRFERRRPEDSSLAGATDLGQAFDWIRMVDAEGYPRAYLESEHLRFEFSEAKRGDDGIDARVRITARR